MRVASIALAAGLLWGASGAVAQEAPKSPGPAEMPKELGPQTGGRFSFAPAEGGYLRLDNTTGQVSFCSERSAGWACQLAPDDRAALDSEIARLQGEIDRLKTASTHAELTPRAGRDDGGLRFPTREEMERARAAVERAWRHFVDMVYDFQKDVTKKD